MTSMQKADRPKGQGLAETLASIEKVTDYADGYDLYRVDVKYNYDVDHMIAYGITSDQALVEAVINEARPYLPPDIEAPSNITLPSFACSAFTLKTSDGRILMGRNYDFATDTSCMLVHCAPRDGYRSVAFAALSNVGANNPLASMTTRAVTLTAPLMCLDGMNEKGVSIAVLTLDSEPVNQMTGKPKVPTSLAIRLVLDRAATTQEAVELLQSYDMLATCGRDYHFYITDASGDGRAVEYDCESDARELVATPVNAVTNFFALYADRLQPGERNRYGHGKDRYEAMLAVFGRQVGNHNNDTAWKALRTAAQKPVAGDITSNTQWSIVFDDTRLTADCVIRRNWSDMFHYDLTANTIGQARGR